MDQNGSDSPRAEFIEAVNEGDANPRQIRVSR